MVGSFFLGVVLGLGRARRAKRTRHHLCLTFCFVSFFYLSRLSKVILPIEYDTISCRQQRLDDLDESFKRVSFITTGKTRRGGCLAEVDDVGFFRRRRRRRRRLRDALATFGTKVERLWVPPSRGK